MWSAICKNKDERLYQGGGKAPLEGGVAQCYFWLSPLATTLFATSWHAASVSIGLSLVQTSSLPPLLPPSRGHKTSHGEVRHVDWCAWHTLPGTSPSSKLGRNVSIFEQTDAKVTHWGERIIIVNIILDRLVQNQHHVWWLSIKKAFPRSVYSCYGVNSAIAFIIDSNYVSHWLAHTFLFTSISLINSVSMVTDTKFDKCYMTLDLRDKYNAFALFLYHISHFSQTISLFLTRYFCPHLLTSLLLFLGPLFSLFYLYCLSALNSLHLPGKVRERAVWGEHVRVNNGEGQLLPNEVCLMADPGPVCMCVVNVFSHSPPPLFSVVPFLFLPQNPFRSWHLGIKC